MKEKEMKESECCGSCCWLMGEDSYGYGTCPFRFAVLKRCDEECSVPEKYVSRRMMRHYLAVLLQANRYRRDGHVPAWHRMPQPTELGKAIDFAYLYIKTMSGL